MHGCDILNDSIVRTSVDRLPAGEPALYHDMLVLGVLEFAAEMRGISDRCASASSWWWKSRPRRRDHHEIRALSKGYNRVGLAQALIHEPPILILDEPMIGLDPNQAVEIPRPIKEIGKLRTVILSTHNLAEVQVACNRVLIISKGKIVADDTPAGLQDRAGRAAASSRSRRPATPARPSDVRRRRRRGARAPDPERRRRSCRFEVFPAQQRRPTPGPDSRPRSTRATQLIGLRRECQNLEQVFAS